MSSSASITAIVTAYKRIGQTLVTLEKLRACRPAPEEILVHVDGNETQCEQAIGRAFPEIKIIVSRESVGPGGGRNKLVAAARNEIVASFDDDSYPIDADYFARVGALFAQFPDASILCAAVFHQGEAVAHASQTAVWISDFIGCGCVYRRSAFLSTSGYVPLTVAYGMEEVDLALRLHAQDGKILRTSWLRVFHDTDLKRHADHEVTAGSIANLALLAYLRYPPSLWIVGFGQCCTRILWLLRNGRRRGVVSGLAMIPAHLSRYRRYRSPVQAGALVQFLNLRRHPVTVSIC